MAKPTTVAKRAAVPKLELLNEHVITFSNLPDDTHAGPTPIDVTAIANLHIITTEPSLDVTVSLAMACVGKPTPPPVSKKITIAAADKDKWDGTQITGHFACPSPEFLTVTAECRISWQDAGSTVELVRGDVFSRVIPAKLRENG